MGPLIVISGPSGSGKSTLIRRLLAEGNWPLRLSVSVTTRSPRPGEIDGKDYYFWTKDAFAQKRNAGGFLEWAEVYGNYYGTLASEVDPYRAHGTGVLLDIDVQGFEQVRKLRPDAVSIFIRPPLVEVLTQRLSARGTEDKASLERRLQGAERELASAGRYDHQVTNDNLEQAYSDLHAILSPLFGRTNYAG